MLTGNLLFNGKRGHARVLRPVPRDRQRGDAGFNLIELLIVLVIISILAAVAVAGYSGTIAKSRQNYAQRQLMVVAQAEEMYRYQNGSYATNAQTAALAPYGWLNTYGGLGFTYTFTITNAGTQVLANGTTVPIFTAQAQGNIDSDATLDTWTIDQNGNLLNTVNDVIQ